MSTKCADCAQEHWQASSMIGCPSRLSCVLQRNIDKIQSNLKELEAKLQHEREKSKTYNEELKIAETKCVPLWHAMLHAEDCG